MENDPCWQNVTDIFQRKVRAKDGVRALEARGETVSRERDDLIDDNVKAIENILDREFPEHKITVKATIREALDIFYKGSASGVSLTQAEPAIARDRPAGRREGEEGGRTGGAGWGRHHK